MNEESIKALVETSNRLVQQNEELRQSNGLTLGLLLNVFLALHRANIYSAENLLEDARQIIAKASQRVTPDIQEKFLAGLQAWLSQELKPNNQQSTDVH